MYNRALSQQRWHLLSITNDENFYSELLHWTIALNYCPKLLP